jgi:hypothetical protein
MLDMLISPETHTALPESVQAEYAERDGQFQLQVDGAFSRTDRDNLHGSLTAERNAHKDTKAKFVGLDGITRESVETIWNTAAERGVRLEQLDNQGDVEEIAGRLADQRVLAQIRPLERTIAEGSEALTAVTTERDALIATRDGKTVSDSVLKAFGSKTIGGKTSAHEDVTLWSERTFELAADGTTVSRDGLDGVTAGLSPKEVFGDMQKDGLREHWFKASVGAGAREGGNFDAASNPFSITSKGAVTSLTACMALLKENPDRAKNMAIAAKATHLFPTVFPAT